MNKVKVKIDQLSVAWDRDYGIDHRIGWSVHIDGICYVQFERHLVIALLKAFWKKRQISD